MAKAKQEKTNAMRLLDRAGVSYEALTYPADPVPTGQEVAAMTGQDPARVFKTLVTTGRSGEHYVFVIPVTGSLDLKKAAKAAGEKAVEMLPQRELLNLTGYVHGGCSPVGMKKAFSTVVDQSAELLDQICFSGGRVGLQLRIDRADLRKAFPHKTADILKEENE